MHKPMQQIEDRPTTRLSRDVVGVTWKVTENVPVCAAKGPLTHDPACAAFASNTDMRSIKADRVIIRLRTCNNPIIAYFKVSLLSPIRAR